MVNVIRCSEVREALALDVGEDLEGGISAELQAHLSGCPECCRGWIDLQESHGHLQFLKHESPVVESPELWDSVSVAIERRGLSPRRSEFPSWILGVAVGVVFTVFFLDALRPADPGGDILMIEEPPRGLLDWQGASHPSSHAVQPVDMVVMAAALRGEAPPATKSAPGPRLHSTGRESRRVRTFRWPSAGHPSTSQPLQLARVESVQTPSRSTHVPPGRLPVIRSRRWYRPPAWRVERPSHQILRTRAHADF